MGACGVAGLILATVLPVVVLPATVLAAGKPSFDCRKAEAAAEKAICADKTLSKADVAIAAAYDRLRRALDARAAEALAADQRGFVAARNAGADWDASGASSFMPLKQRLQDRAKFLAGIEARPPEGFAGKWRNVSGGLDIEVKADGSFSVSGDTVEPEAGRWVCEIAGEGRKAGDAMEVRQDKEASTLKLTRDGAILKVETVFPAGSSERTVGYCGQNGSVDGSYFRVSAPGK